MKAKERIEFELRESAPDLVGQIADKAGFERKTAIKSESIAIKRKIGFAFAACALLMAVIIPLSITLTTQRGQPVAYASYDVIIDVNPNMALTVGEGEKVTAQRGLNEDGVVFLHSRNYIGQDINSAACSIVSELKSKGVITSGGVVRLSVYDSKTRSIDDEAQFRIEKNLQSLLGDEVTMLFLSDDELDKMEEYYENYTVKEDEKTLIDKFKNRVVEVAKAKIAQTQALLDCLGGYLKEEEDVYLTESQTEKLNEYLQKYKVEIEFKSDGGIEFEEFEDFCEDIQESIEELEEDVKEISEMQDDYSELMEELIDLLKDCLWD